jgi:hypothetical protein
MKSLLIDKIDWHENARVLLSNESAICQPYMLLLSGSQGQIGSKYYQSRQKDYDKKHKERYNMPIGVCIKSELVVYISQREKIKC